MDRIKIDIKISDTLSDPPLDEETLNNALFVEDAPYCLRVSEITLRGKYDRKYKIVAFCVGLNADRVLIDKDLLIICLWSDLLIIDLNIDKLIKIIHFDCWEMFGIYKFKTGYFIHGEDTTRYLNGDFEQVWEGGCVDIFVNFKADRVVNIFDDCWTIIDWYGYKHYYNEKGEYKTEYCSQYDPDKDGN